MISRRGLVKAGLWTGAGTFGTLAADQLAGIAYEDFWMRNVPQTEVALLPGSGRTTLVVGGLGNDGIAAARAMAPRLDGIGSVIGVRYAENNVQPAPLVQAIAQAITQFRLQGDRIDAYLNSAAGPIMAEPLRQLSRRLRIGTVIFDSAPRNAADVKGDFGNLIKYKADLLGHSRIVDLISHAEANAAQPPPTDKESDVPLQLAAAHRQAIVDADSIQLSAEAAAIRRGVAARALQGCAEDFVFIHGAGDDPLIFSDNAVKGWVEVCGTSGLREVIDTERPPNSHAAGVTYPFGVSEVLLGNA